MWKHTPTNKSVRPGKGWSDENGIQHPANWHVWGMEEKADKGLVEIIQQTPPDSRFYHWSQNPDGTVTSTERDLAEIKENLVAAVDSAVSSNLGKSDWMFIRQIDTNRAIPLATRQYRDAVRDAAEVYELAVEAALDVAELEAIDEPVWPEDVAEPAIDEPVGPPEDVAALEATDEPVGPEEAL